MQDITFLLYPLKNEGEFFLHRILYIYYNQMFTNIAKTNNLTLFLYR